jgi:hypothetical protein
VQYSLKGFTPSTPLVTKIRRKAIQKNIIYRALLGQTEKSAKRSHSRLGVSTVISTVGRAQHIWVQAVKFLY